jgi:hypothetical protein
MGRNGRQGRDGKRRDPARLPEIAPTTTETHVLESS